MKGRVRQRSPGSWEISYELGRDSFGKRCRGSVTVRGTKAQAQRELREILTAIDQGQDPTPADISLREWLNRWMSEVIIPNRRQRTQETYQNAIDRHIVPHLGGVSISKLGPSQVQALETQLSQHLSAKMVNQVHIVLSGALKYALRLELVHRNPVSLVSPPSVKRPEIVPPDIAAVRSVLALSSSDGNDLYTALHLIAYTGLRRGEAMALNWEQVDLEDGFLRIEGSLVNARAGIILEPPKTSSGRRTVDLDPGTVQVLKEHLLRQRETRERMGDLYTDQGHVFADDQGNWISPKRLYDTVKRYGRRVGHPDMTVRSLRHFHASLMLQSGQNIVVVSKRLGHSTVSITSDIYAHSLPGWQRQAAEAFAAAMEDGE